MNMELVLIIGALLILLYFLDWNKIKKWYNILYNSRQSSKHYSQRTNKSQINNEITSQKKTAKNYYNENPVTYENNPSGFNSVNQNDLNKTKGNAFEEYIVGLFDVTSGRFNLKHWRSDKLANSGMYAESNKYPDLEFAFKGDYKTDKFAIECKYRSSFYNGVITWAEPRQIQNYINYEREYKIKVFVAIGIGGSPNYPNRLFIVPLEQIHSYPNVFESYLKNFERNPNHNFFYNQKDKILL